MSIKGFHIVFVSVCTLLCLFIAMWAFVLIPEHTLLTSVMGYLGVLGVILMPLYGVYFYRKASKIIV